MREIKFRGKAIDSGDLVYGFLLLTDDRAYIHPIRDGLDFDDVDFGYGFIQIDLKTVGQFTGLRDKNCKEIYEGDICRIVRYNGELQTAGDIFFDKGAFRITNGYAVADTDSLGRFKADIVEVIGNIHEHSHLLK